MPSLDELTPSGVDGGVAYRKRAGEATTFEVERQDDGARPAIVCGRFTIESHGRVATAFRGERARGGRRGGGGDVRRRRRRRRWDDDPRRERAADRARLARLALSRRRTRLRGDDHRTGRANTTGTIGETTLDYRLGGENGIIGETLEYLSRGEG